jgi:hypothetical protein
MKIYYRGGIIRDDQRMEVNDTVMSRDLAQRQVKIDKYYFELAPGLSIDGALIYDCINEHMKKCEDCSGHGEYECHECDGTGTKECEECNTTGYVRDEDKEDEKRRKEEEAAENKRIRDKNQINMGF